MGISAFSQYLNYTRNNSNVTSPEILSGGAGKPWPIYAVISTTATSPCQSPGSFCGGGAHSVCVAAGCPSRGRRAARSAPGWPGGARTSRGCWSCRASAGRRRPAPRAPWPSAPAPGERDHYHTSALDCGGLSKHEKHEK